MFDYRLTDEQIALQKMAHEFAEKEVRPIGLELDHNPDPAKSAYMEHLLEKADKVGLRTMGIPEKYGGGGIDDLFSHCIVGEDLSWGNRGVCGMLLSATKAAHVLGSEELCPSEEIRSKWLRAYCEDPNFLISTATTEPNSGSENLLTYSAPDAGYRTSAVRDGDEYVINGMKCFVSNIGWAKLYFVYVRTDQTKGVEEGASFFMIPRDTPGVSHGRVHDKMGYRLNLNRELIMENVRVPVENRLGPENCGVSFIRRHMRGDALINAAAMVGLARAAYEDTLEYAKTRVASGKPLIEHQAIATKIIDMYTNIEAARSLVLYAAWRVDAAWNGVDGKKIPGDPKMSPSASYFAHEVACDVTRWAMEIHGGMGVMKELPIEMYFRDAHNMMHSDGGNIMKRLKAIQGL